MAYRETHAKLDRLLVTPSPTHRLRIRNREDGTRLRRLRVADRAAQEPVAVRP